jgi:hypothetical protein
MSISQAFPDNDALLRDLKDLKRVEHIHRLIIEICGAALIFVAFLRLFTRE